MSTICRSEKIGKDISYIIIKREDNSYSINLTAYDKTYETDTGSVHHANNWIDQIIKQVKNETRRIDRKE